MGDGHYWESASSSYDAFMSDLRGVFGHLVQSSEAETRLVSARV